MGTDLRDLIAEHKGDRSFERLAADSGGTPTRQRWQQLATRGLERGFPDPDTIAGIAIGLGVTVTTVVVACSQSLGLDVRAGASYGLDLEGLTARQADAVRELVRAITAERQTDGTPMTTVTVVEESASGATVRAAPEGERQTGSPVRRVNRDGS